MNKHIQDKLKEFEDRFEKVGYKPKPETIKDFLQKALEDIYQKGYTAGAGSEMAKHFLKFSEVSADGDAYEEGYQKGKEDAVRGFAEYLMRDEYDKPIREIPSYHYTALIDLAETYLSTTKEEQNHAE